MVRGLSRLSACAALSLAALFSAGASAQHTRAQAPGNANGGSAPGSIGADDPSGVPIERPSATARTLLGREATAAAVRGSVMFRNGGVRRAYQAVTPAGEALNRATSIGLAPAMNQPVEMVGVNLLVVGFTQPTDLAGATAFFRQLGLQGEVTQMTRLKSVFRVRTPNALAAFQVADVLGANPAVRFAQPDMYAQFTDFMPTLELRQGMTVINNGGMYDFGATTQGSAVQADFRITNTGDMPLSLAVGTVPTGFSVVTPFPANPIAAGGTFDFTLAMTASTVGMPSGDLEILNNSAVNPFTVTLSGTVNAPMGPAEVRVSLAGTNIPSGTGSVDFGATTEGAPVTRTFTIHNDGANPLTVSAVSVPSGFTVTTQPVSPIGGGASTDFIVELDATASGTFTGSASFLNNDADENPFTFTISGSVMPEGGGGGNIEDPLYENQWHLANTGQDDGVETLDVNAEEAWERGLGSGAIVAIMDSSIQPDHPDYAGNVIPCPACVNFFDLATNPDTGVGNHGTAVTGLVAAQANSIGVRGVAPEASVILTSYIGLDGDGLSASETADNWAAAADEGASVHTNSWGYKPYFILFDIQRDTIADLTDNARDGRGMLFLFATANDYTLTVYGNAFAALDETLGVGGVDNFAMRAAYANFGLATDVVGPTQGVSLGITTTDVTGNGGYNRNASSAGGDYTNTFNGTSAATPIVAGVAGLTMAQNENLHAAQLKRILQHTSSQNSSRNDLLVLENLGFNRSTSFNESFGYGVPNARLAVDAAADAVTNGGFTWPAMPTGVTVNQTASFTNVSWTNPPTGPKGEYAGAIVARMTGVIWKPTDGQQYTVGQAPAQGVQIIAVGDQNSVQDTGVTLANNAVYAVFTYNSINRYSFGALGYAAKNDGTTTLFDNFETDRGWVATGEWERGTPNTDTMIVDYLNFQGNLDSVVFDTPPRTRGFNVPRSGANCFATDLDGTYNPSTQHALFSPVIDLAGSDARSVSLSYWEMLELQTNNPGTNIRVDVVSENTGSPTVIRQLRATSNPGNLYSWTPRQHDLSEQIGQRFRIRFLLTAADPQTEIISQFQGWFLDDVRIAVDGTVVQPPPTTRRPGLIRLPPPGGFLVGLFGMEPIVHVSQSPDVNDDGKVDAVDLTELVKRFGLEAGDDAFEARFDLDDDGRVTMTDLAAVLAVALDPTAYTALDEPAPAKR